MKRCNHCDREVMNDAKFCQFCGADVISEADFSNESKPLNTQRNEAPPLPEINVFKESFKQPETGGYQNTYAKTPPPPTNKGMIWLILSSISTFLGCFCFGIGILQVATIITSAISVSKHNRGDYDGSNRMAKTSKILFFSILALSILIIIIVVAAFYTTGDFADVVNEFY